MASQGLFQSQLYYFLTDFGQVTNGHICPTTSTEVF